MIVSILNFTKNIVDKHFSCKYSQNCKQNNQQQPCFAEFDPVEHTDFMPFHLAFPVKELVNIKNFYQNIIGCSVGRSTDEWIDFNFFGHQVVAHLSPASVTPVQNSHVDNKAVPCRHFGAVLGWEKFDQLAQRLKQNNVEFIIEPYLRFEGKVGEQKTMFILDPSGNALEFKSFKNRKDIFDC